jgi:hypothetical protein
VRRILGKGCWVSCWVFVLFLFKPRRRQEEEEEEEDEEDGVRLFPVVGGFP